MNGKAFQLWLIDGVPGENFGEFGSLPPKFSPEKPNQIFPDIGTYPLHLAVRYGHEGVVKELLKNGADVNLKDERNLTPIHVCLNYSSLSVSINTKLKIFMLLLESGGDLTIPDNNGESPYYCQGYTILEHYPKYQKIIEEYGKSMTWKKWFQSQIIRNFLVCSVVN